MKKTLIASAVAAATLASTNAFADAHMPEFYGNIQLAWANATVDNGTDGVLTFDDPIHPDVPSSGDDIAAGEEGSYNGTVDNGSTFGIKHSHAISEDVTGFLKAEFHFDADDKKNESLGEELDEAYIGVKGDFGSIQAGTDDTVYEWVDIMDMYEFAGLEGDLATQKEGDNIQYYSPEMSGLTVGVTVPVDSDSQFGGALAAKYAMDNIEVVLAYGLGREEDVDPDTGEKESGDAFGLGVTFGLDDLTLMAAYESRGEGKNAAGADMDNGTDYMAFMAQYAMGANNFALGYSVDSYDADGAEDTSSIYVQALHNVSDNMYVYLEYLTATDVGGVEDVDADIFALGATYSF